MLLNFPRVRSGLGLLILRGTVAGVVLMLEGTRASNAQSGILSFSVIGLAFLIALGLFTSYASTMTALLIGLLAFTSRSELMVRGIIAALCAALILMGGGAYSIDGLLHGRRRILLPKT
jgi:hypothetical protein